MKMYKNDIKQEVTANVIESDEVTFLCGKEILMEWKMVLDFEDRKLGFKELGGFGQSFVEGGKSRRHSLEFVDNLVGTLDEGFDLGVKLLAPVRG